MIFINPFAFLSSPISLIGYAPDPSIASFTWQFLTLACAYNTNMSSPSRRNSDIPLSDAGPPRSVLQRLLEEINGSDSPPTTPRPTPKSVSRTASVWCGGGSIAQDARTKLRVMDEARQRKMSINSIDFTPEDSAPPPLRRHSTQLGAISFPVGRSVRRPQSDPSKTIQVDAFEDSSSSSADSVTSLKNGSCGNISRMYLGSEYL
jgi:hypothetical protein